MEELLKTILAKLEGLETGQAEIKEHLKRLEMKIDHIALNKEI